MSGSRAFASLSSSLLARKGGARPAMRSGLQGQGDGRPHDPLGDLGWNDMGEDAVNAPANAPIAATAARGPEAVVVFAPAPAQTQSQALAPAPAPAPAPATAPVAAAVPLPAAAPKPLLARKPVAAEIVQLVRDPPMVRPVAAVPLTHLAGHAVLRRTRPAAFTLRLDPDRHFRLRTACGLQARSAQAIVTEAVDRFLDALPELEPLGSHAAAQRIA